MQFAPPAQAPAAPAPKQPARPMTPAQQKAADLAAIAGTNEEFAKLAQHGKQGGPLVLTGAAAQDKRLADVTTPYTIDKPKTAMEEAREEVAKVAGGPPLMMGGSKPVGWIPGSHTVQRKPGMSDEEMAPVEGHLRKANEYATDATLIEEYLAKQKGTADAAYANAVQYANDAHQDKLASLHQRRDDYVKANLDRLHQLTALANKDVDEKAWHKEVGTLGQVLAGIAVGLGQFGALMRGGENNAYTIINNAINRNIDAQIRRKKDARDQLAAESDLYKTNLLAFKDEEAALAATRFQYLENVKTTLDAELAKHTSNQVAQANGLRLREKLEREQASEADKIAQRKHDDFTEAMNEHFSMGGPGLGAGVGNADAKWLSEAYEKAGIPQSLAELEGVDRIIDTFGTGDIPGVGRIKDYLPAEMLSKEGQANRQALATVKNKIRKSIAGSSLTDSEKAELNKSLEGAYDGDSVRRLVQSLRTSLHHQQRNIAAGARPEGKITYEMRGGPVKDMRLDKPTTPYQRPIGDK